VGKVSEAAGEWEDVVVARDYKYMCSGPGQDLIVEDIEEFDLDRVVVASCSPRMHEPTFRRFVEAGGLNGYMLEMANIREHVSWVSDDPEAATKKATAIVRAAVNRVRHHEQLHASETDMEPTALVIGGGIAGIEAALKLSKGGKHVYLVEKEPSIGGHMAMLDKTFPTLDCSACILTPKMVEVSQDPNITLWTYSEVEKVDGFIGNFDVTVRRKARSVDEELCTGCGDCMETCPGSTPSEFDQGLVDRSAIYRPFPQAVPNVPAIDKESCWYYTGKAKCQVCARTCPADAIQFDKEDELETVKVGAIIVATGFDQIELDDDNPWGYGRYDNVISGLEFERMVNASGPTSGHVTTSEGKEPESVAILHCIGSRDKDYKEYCSRICCMYSLKFAHLVRDHLDADVYEYYIDMRTFGKGYEEFYERLLSEEVNFIRGKGAEVRELADGSLMVRAEDTLLGEIREIPVDMVILSIGIEPSTGSEKLAQLLSVQRSEDGFLMELHPKLEPMKTATDGIFLAGACQSPKDIPDTVAHAGGAASEALSLISAGSVVISPATAYNVEEKCSGCRLCVSLCPFGAIEFNEEKEVAEYNSTLCKGCGTCVAACPSGAARMHHFEDEQLLAQLEGVTQE
jgi:heterodisulfide reductase subunit A